MNKKHRKPYSPVLRTKIILGMAFFCALFSFSSAQAVDETTVEELIPHEFHGGGTAQGWHGDDRTWLYNLPFTFTFYGNDYTSVNINSNGTLDFEYANSSTSGSLDRTNGPFISPLWVDLRTDINPGDDIYITENAESVIIRWQVVDYSDQNPINFEVELFQSGSIKMNYAEQPSAPLSRTPTVGISKGDGTIYTTSAYHEQQTFHNVQTSTWIDRPQLTSSSPLQTDSNIPVDTSLTAVFADSIQQGTGNIILKRSADDTTVETISISSSQITGWGTNMLTIDPANILDYDTSYYILIDSSAIKDNFDVFFAGITDSTTWSFTTKKQYSISFNDNLIQAIPSCECYKVGSAEANVTPGGAILYSSNGQKTWDHTLSDDGSGSDCSVTHVKLEYPITTHHVGEDLQAEFTGTLSNTRTKADGNGEVELGEYDIGTYTMGGTSHDEGYSTTTDPAGNIYLTGYFWGTVDFDPTASMDNHTSNGNNDIFLTKINADGTYGYTYTMGGTSSGIGRSTTTDSTGNIYLTGYFSGTVDFDPTAGIDNHTSSGNNDIFLTKINADGVYGYTFTMGGTDSDLGRSITTDPAGNIYLTGRFFNTVDFDPTAGTDNHASDGGQDIFLTKINADGTYGYTYTMGGTGSRSGHSTTTDPAGNIYLTGFFAGTPDFDPTAGIDNHTSSGIYDIFLTKINADGTYGYTYTMGGTSYEFGYSTTTDSSGNIYLTGLFNDTVDFDPTVGTDNHTSNGNHDIFLTKINADGSYGYTYTMGGSSADEGHDVTVDSVGNIFVTGFFSLDTVDFDPTAGTDNHTSSGRDIFLTKINVDGSYGYTYTMGRAGIGRSVTTGPAGNIYLTGAFRNTVDFNPTTGTDNHTSNGNDDIFLTKINTDGTYGSFTTSHYASGFYQTQIISHADPTRWDTLTLTQTTPANTALLHEVRDASCSTVLLSTTDTTIDLTSIPNTYTSLCLRTTFTTTDDTVTPQLESWDTEYTINTTPTDRGFIETIDSPICTANEIIETLTSCQCYQLNSAESAAPAHTTILYSNNNQSSWGYTPVDNGSGTDCSVTDLKMVYTDTAEVHEDTAVEFEGSLANTRIVANDNGEVELDEYDRGTYTMGGINTDYIYSTTIDTAGNIYLTGYFYSTVDFDPTANIDNHISNGAEDVFLTKINADGSYGYTYTMGGMSSDRGYGTITDLAGNIYLTGNFWGTVDFDPTAGTDNHTSNGSYDIFLTKINADGTYGYTHTMGGTSGDYGYSTVTDADGNSYLTGYFYGTADFDPTASTDNHTSSGSADIFLTKINADGSYGYTYTMGGTSFDYGQDTTIDSAGNIYLTGNFAGTADFDPTVGIDNHVSNGSYDISLTKINADGSYGYTYTMGGTSTDYGRSTTIDSTGNIYLIGYFAGTADFDPTASTDDHTSSGSYDIFLTKLNADGSYGYTYTMGGTSADRGESTTIDSVGNIYLTGYFYGTADFDPTASTDNHTSSGSADIFLTKINADGSYGYTYTMGGINYDIGIDTTIDSTGNIYLTGNFFSTVDFNPTAGTDNHTSNGSSDIFLTKINADGSYGAFQTPHYTSGSYQTQIQPYISPFAWTNLSFTHTTPPNTTLSHQVFDATCSTPLTPSTTNNFINLSYISHQTTPLCLQTTFTTQDENISPDLAQWQVNYTTFAPLPADAPEHISYTTTDDTQCTSNELIEPIPSCKCYILGSAELNAPPNSIVSYSNNNKESFDYIPQDNGNGFDCSVTYIKLHYADGTSKVYEDLEIEFIGSFADTQTVPDGNGVVELGLIDSEDGTYTMGGTNNDYGQGVATDPAGNIYVMGDFWGTVDFDPTTATDVHTSNGSYDIYLTKINADGTYDYTYTIGGANNDYGQRVTVDHISNIYLTGNFQGATDFDPTTGTDVHTSNGNTDIYLTKINADGSYGYTYTMGGTNWDYVDGTATDPAGNIYLTGNFQGAIDFDPTAGTDNRTSSGGTDIFLTKINADGSYGYTHAMGGTGNDYGRDTTTDPAGSIYLTGSFRDTVDFDPTAGIDNHISSGNSDIFLTKINPDGSYGYTFAMGGTGYDYGQSATTDPTGNIYITGDFADTVDFDPTTGTDNHTSNGSSDIFLTKINADGSYGYTHTIGEMSNDYVTSTTTDPAGNIYLTGRFYNTVDFDPTTGTDNHTSNGSSDIFLTKINADGSYGYTHTVGGANWDYSYGTTTDPTGNIYLTGNFYDDAVDFNPTAGTDIHINSGDNDIFLTKINADGTYGSFTQSYIPTGTYETLITPHAQTKEWQSLFLIQNTPTATALTHEVLDASCTTPLIASTANTQLDLSTISPTESPLCLRSTFTTTDGIASPYIDRWEALYTTEAEEPNFGFHVANDPLCVVITDFTAPQITKITDIGRHNLTLKINVNDPNYYNKELTFTVKITNTDKGKEEFRTIIKTTDDNGNVSLKIDELKSNTHYSFRVSFTSDAYTSVLSNKEEAQTDPDIKDNDAKPVDLNAEAISPTSIHLTWTDEAKGENGYLVERRREGDTEFTQIASLDKNTEEYTDTDVIPGVTYVYRVRAFHGDDYTGYSNEAQATTIAQSAVTVIEEVPVEEIVESPQEQPQEETTQETTEQEQRPAPQQEETPKTQEEPENPSSKENIQQFLENTQDLRPLITALGLFSGVVLTTAATVLPVVTSALPTSQVLLTSASLLGLVGKRRKRPQWGTVFDTVTKRPIPGVAVQIRSNTGQLLDTANADSKGHYGFIVKNGSYTLDIDSSHYTMNYKSSIDALYGKVYDGQSFTAQEGQPLSINIALTRENLDWQERVVRKMSAGHGFLRIAFKFFFGFLFYAGFLYTIAVSLLYPKPLNAVLAILYTVFVVFAIFQIRKPSYGILTDKVSHKPIPFAVVSLFTDVGKATRVAFAVTDEKGRYFLFVKNGTYTLNIEGRSLSGQQVSYTDTVVIEKGVFRGDMVL